MARILIFCTDLPYFPGKNGNDFFNLRHLAGKHQVTVVSPISESALPEGVKNLEQAVEHVYGWPRPVDSVPLFVDAEQEGGLSVLINRMPSGLRSSLLRIFTGTQRAPADAHSNLAVLANCAPHLLKAFHDGAFQAIVLIQSNTAPCLEYLPGSGARVVYFHDVRSDYLARRRAISSNSLSPAEVEAVRRQEVHVCRSVDAVGFVSELDEERAKRLLEPTAVTGVSPIPVDTTYFIPAPANFKKSGFPTVLFTGHLSHPPNVDALQYFITAIWPLILAEVPDARFVVAGLMPSPEIRGMVETVRNFELRSNVPDIRPYFWNADVYVVPMRFGGGVRQKIFEAWAMEVPVICTSMAAEGISVRNGTNCWLEDSPAAFASRVVKALAGQKDTNLTAAAKQQVEATQSIPVAAQRFVDIVEKAIAIKKARPFRVLFDLRWMEIGKSGGTEQMTHELVAALARLDHRNEYRLFCPRSTYYEWQFPAAFRVKPVFCDLTEAKTERLRAGVANRLAGGLGLPSIFSPPMRTLGALRRLDYDLVHSTGGYIHPDLEAFPQVLTVHDLQHIHHPDFFSESEWQTRDRLYRDSAKRAKHIICISEYTRQDLHQTYGVPLEKMSTIWNIPSQQSWRMLDASVRERLVSKQGISKPFLFFPGHCWPHKNHAKLVEAFAQILPHIPKGMNLVFSGRKFSADHPAQVLIRELELEHRVVHLGYRSPFEIQALFQSCFCLVFPSLFEGFGLPVAEAIIAGKPVVCSNRTSLPEIAGDAALTFDPTNVHDIGRCLLEIITDSSRYAALSEASKQRRQLFSARRSALKTLAIYHRVYHEMYA